MRDVLKMLICTALSTACGSAQDAAKKDDSQTTTVKTEAKEPETAIKPTEVGAPKVAPSEAPEKAPLITKDQMTRASIRLIFDNAQGQGKLFHDEVFKTYFLRGDEGTMSYPDSSYLPVSTKNVAQGCPLGFKQVGQIDLSIGMSHGLFDHLPPDSQWIWTSWKAGSDVNAYYAMTTSDFTDQWGYTFNEALFYPKHKSRIIGRLYCMMDEHDLPNIDDLPPEYLDSLKGH